MVQTRIPRRTVLLGLGALALGVLPGVVSANARPRWRIVTLDGSLLETVCLLGGGDDLVGADNRDRYPRSMEALPRIGDPHAVSVEGILSLAPDVVLRTTGRGPDDRMRQLEAAGVEVVTLPADYTLENVIHKVRVIAELLDRQATGARYIEKLETNIARLERVRAGLTDMPTVTFVLDIDRGSLLAAGEGTPAAAMIRLAEGRPVPEGFSGFRRISTEVLMQQRPDYVLMGDHTVRRLGGRAAVLATAPFRMAGIEDTQLIDIEVVSLLGFSPRATHALAELMAALHPQLERPALEPIEIPG